MKESHNILVDKLIEAIAQKERERDYRESTYTYYPSRSGRELQYATDELKRALGILLRASLRFGLELILEKRKR